MSQQIKNVIIIGANGNLGPSILQALEKSGDFTVSVLSRKGSKSTYASHIKVHEVDESYPEEELVSAFKGQDAVVVTIPVFDASKIKVLIDAAIKAEVKRFIPSEFGSDTTQKKVVETLPIFSPKIEVIEYLRSRESSGLSWTAIVTGAFFDWGLENGFLGFDTKTKTGTVYNDGNAPLLGTLLSTIGTAVARTLQKPSETVNKYVFISDYRVTQNELRAELEKASGGEKYKITNVKSPEVYDETLPKVLQGDFSALIGLLQSVIFSGDDIYDYETNHGLDNEKLGLPKPEPLGAVVAKVVKGKS